MDYEFQINYDDTKKPIFRSGQISVYGGDVKSEL